MRFYFTPCITPIRIFQLPYVAMIMTKYSVIFIFIFIFFEKLALETGM